MEATRRELPDYLEPGLKVVFVGFNPSVYSAKVGHYYARPTNQFWRCLNESGLLPGGEKLEPRDDSRLLEFGIGVTDIVKRCSKSSNDLRSEDYRVGRQVLREKLKQAAPSVVAFNGKGVYEEFSGHPVELGPQRDPIGGSRVFVLPSTSALNARLTFAQKLAYFRRLARWVKRQRRQGVTPDAR